MLFLLITFVLTAASLTVLLWVVTLFFQGYYYTQPTTGIHWQAPAAGGALALVITFWCLLLVQSSTARPADIPYDTIFRFSPREEQFLEPVKELWILRKGVKEPIPFKRHKEINPYGGVSIVYKDNFQQLWKSSGVVAIVLKGDHDDKRTFNLVPNPVGSYRQFVDDQGWVIMEYDDGPTGIPVASRWGRFLINILLNLLHFAAWFISLWLLLRFTWGHALGLGFVLWLVMTLAILPMLLEQAAAVSRQRAAQAQVVSGQGSEPPERPSRK